MANPPERRGLPPEITSLIETVAALQEDVTVLKAMLLDERWQKVGDNLSQLSANDISLHERVLTIERELFLANKHAGELING